MSENSGDQDQAFRTPAKQISKRNSRYDTPNTAIPRFHAHNVTNSRITNGSDSAQKIKELEKQRNATLIETLRQSNADLQLTLQCERQKREHAEKEMSNLKQALKRKNVENATLQRDAKRIKVENEAKLSQLERELEGYAIGTRSDDKAVVLMHQHIQTELPHSRTPQAPRCSPPPSSASARTSPMPPRTHSPTLAPSPSPTESLVLSLSCHGHYLQKITSRGKSHLRFFKIVDRSLCWAKDLAEMGKKKSVQTLPLSSLCSVALALSSKKKTDSVVVSLQFEERALELEFADAETGHQWEAAWKLILSRQKSAAS